MKQFPSYILKNVKRHTVAERFKEKEINSDEKVSWWFI